MNADLFPAFSTKMVQGETFLSFTARHNNGT